MQSEKIKLIKTTKNQLFLFYHTKGSLFYKQYEGARFSESILIKNNISEMFSVCEGEDGLIYIICSDASSIYFLKKTGQHFVSKKIMEIPSPSPIASKFYFSVERNKIHFIYNTYHTEEKTHQLMYITYSGGSWESPYKIDSFLPFKDVPYIVKEIERSHILLLYKSAENKICSRELLLSPLTLGTLNTLVQSRANITDTAFLADEEKLHMLFVVKGVSSTKLLYKSKTQSKISPSSALYEGKKIDSCIFLKQNNSLWAVWAKDNQLFYMVSDNNGQSFSTPLKYKGLFGLSCVKGEYHSYKEETVFVSQLYVDTSNYNHIPILSDTCPAFFPAAASLEEKPAIEKTETTLTADIYKNKLEYYENTINELNAQIVNLTEELSKRRNDVLSVNSTWKTKYTNLFQQIEQKDAKIKILSDELHHLHQMIQQNKIPSSNPLLLSAERKSDND